MKSVIQIQLFYENNNYIVKSRISENWKLTEGKSGFGCCQVENDIYIAGGNDGD
jgi:hypothetical protein